MGIKRYSVLPLKQKMVSIGRIDGNHFFKESEGYSPFIGKITMCKQVIHFEKLTKCYIKCTVYVAEMKYAA